MRRYKQDGLGVVDPAAPAQPGQASLPADDPSTLGGEFTGTWHEPVLSAITLINTASRLNSDRGPNMPTASA